MTEIGDFLQSRRARIRPAEVGLPEGVRRRRVPGLRREELAQLAGVSMGYYTRLEQGAADGASDSVLDAIARVLRLDPTETAHLRRLARPGPRRPAPPEVLRPSVANMVAAIRDVPVLVLGRRFDVLAWNRLCRRVIAPNVAFDATPFNVIRMIFRDSAAREIYADWESKARDNVAFLRVSAAKYPGDTELAALVGELRTEVPEFAAMWDEQPIELCATATRVYRVPGVGELEFTSEMLALPDDEGQHLAIYHPAAGSATEEILRALAAETAGVV
ncbi:helix-turn-helix transcriptional regulator [Phytomonospora endophytica]|uniref:Transcriptional regulator with XRE-family HTH domain n=1 Tax=Phytomonospora endophytica TaxID=714109 RepID=A0A841FUB6_9ACTN|nr:helix-turn-helix transcriptional regulator [Phytomonospora endophytica]MBB6036119.1 transcriptional regulator with XRE-family HTH domain [Phytomonospora endophytica]GIG67022.1 transcriptional regulator [Phytomonospora endophytica]